jgi:hypothetical protein
VSVSAPNCSLGHGQLHREIDGCAKSTWLVTRAQDRGNATPEASGGAVGVIEKLPHLLDTPVFLVVNFRLAQSERRASHRSGRLFQLASWCDPTTVGALNQPYATSNSNNVRRGVPLR